jgi:hypothetical protein
MSTSSSSGAGRPTPGLAEPSRLRASPASSRKSTRTGSAHLLRLDERTAVRTTIDAKAGPEGGGDQIVTVTLDGLADDSVRAERWTLGFEEGEDGVYALTGALRELRCHEGRGHQDFAGEACT